MPTTLAVVMAMALGRDQLELGSAGRGFSKIRYSCSALPKTFEEKRLSTIRAVVGDCRESDDRGHSMAAFRFFVEYPQQFVFGQFLFWPLFIIDTQLA